MNIFKGSSSGQLDTTPIEPAGFSPVHGHEKDLEMPTRKEEPQYEVEIAATRGTYRVYKRRFFGLLQLVLLNIIISWDWLTFSSISSTSAEYFNVTESTINWLSTAFLFAFCAATPVVMYMLNKGGPKPVIITASVLILVGNWVRYAGTKANNGTFSVVMFGQLLLGLAQPFALSAPTRYSDLWFTEQGRTSATALATLANPLGAAVGQLVDSFWAVTPGEIPGMVLWISVISTIACIPSFFIPARPPTPASASSIVSKTPFPESAKGIIKIREFWLVFIPFSVYVGFFNSVSTLINQILYPYGFSETEAGIAGGVLIVVGLVASAIVSPINDRYKKYLLVIRICIPIHAISYIALYFAPSSPFGIAPSIVVCGLLGASAFSILPVVLEFLVEITYPYSPEISSTLLWMGGQLLGGIFTIIQSELKAGQDANPPLNMKRALIFSAVIACVAAVFPLTLNVIGPKIVNRRLEADQNRCLDVQLESHVNNQSHSPTANDQKPREDRFEN
ncbi:putative cell surface receptor/MFS transporter [Talaromyces proteolyticus]|uniref:Cell surface receptor/MFS transporter n=1 Tax=Talaromyces proteolyticus TaxID=1131652 RepID=A0AAD4KS61_9EURO|nr:putative cell surface receptor/MFS transporter [Talaromyces proteolyticus]KAH8697618.1 putative cell surface receptor/MFS transporter [Talaromyces proteolyticus]